MKSMTSFCTLVALVFSFTLANGVEVQRSEISSDGFTADYYAPESPKDVVILFLGGAEGGKPDVHLPSMLAAQGYPVLAPAYFKAKGLPESLEMIPLEYFDKVLRWIEKHPGLRDRRLIAFGGSKGAELALLLASRKPKIEGVIAQAPSSVVWQGIPTSFGEAKSSWSTGGQPLPFVPYDMSAGFDYNDLLGLYKRSLAHNDAVEKAVIPVELTNGAILLLSGQNDKLWPSAAMGDAVVDRLKQKVFKHRFEHVKYVDAGHTMNEYFMIGGTKEGNQEARLDSTKRILDFLDRVRK